jgi:carbon storage regulator
MLVLTRGIGEELVIGDNIRVQVISIQGSRVRIGIDAPPEVTVDRAEIHLRRIAGEKTEALTLPCRY